MISERDMSMLEPDGRFRFDRDCTGVLVGERWICVCWKNLVTGVIFPVVIVVKALKLGGLCTSIFGLAQKRSGN